MNAIIFPYPLQGHVIPAVNLAIKLASAGFTITFINTQSIHHQISKATGIPLDRHIFHDSPLDLDIRYATVTDGFPLEFDRSLHHDQFFDSFLEKLSEHVDEAVGKLVRQDPTIGCIIVDTFFVWGSYIARKYNLVYISFFTEPALVLTLYYHIHLLKNNHHFAASPNRRDTIDYIPGVKSIDPTDLTSYLQATDDVHTTVHQIIYKAFEDAKKADLMLCNTVEELEHQTIAALQLYHPFYAVGPIFPTTRNRISTSLWPESDCSHWLDSKPPASVLYVSFGSYAHTTKHVLEEIAYGLLLSGVYFVWVLRPDIVSSDHPVVLPDSLSGRGLVVPWCNQMTVVSHPSVGGFLTHCGWNSILESIWCGVPMICYPLLTDQFTNRKLVVDDWKIGVNLCDKGTSLSRQRVCDNVTCLMKSQDIRQQINKLGKILQIATEPNGSSLLNFNRFIQDLEAKIVEYKG